MASLEDFVGRVPIIEFRNWSGSAIDALKQELEASASALDLCRNSMDMLIQLEGCYVSTMVRVEIVVEVG